MTRKNTLRRTLYIALTVCLVLSLAAAFLTPVAVMTDRGSVFGGMGAYLRDIFVPGADDIVAAGVSASLISWVWVWLDAQNILPALTMLAVLLGTAALLQLARRHLRTGEEEDT